MIIIEIYLDNECIDQFFLEGLVMDVSILEQLDHGKDVSAGYVHLCPIFRENVPGFQG